MHERVSGMDSVHEPEVQLLLCMGIPGYFCRGGKVSYTTDCKDSQNYTVCTYSYRSAL